MQCSHPADTTSPLTHLLGGQHGEEAKEDGEGSEEGREKDEAPEEEVSTGSNLRLRTTSVTASHGPALVESGERIMLDTPVPVPG